MYIKEKNVSTERLKYLNLKQKRKVWIHATQILFLIFLFVIWEITAKLELIDTFIMSSPSRMWNTLLNLSSNGILTHVKVTLYETLVGFGLGIIFGILLATVLWWSPFLTKVFSPYLVVLNSLPKIALGPVIIIWMGASAKAIIFMAIAISLIVTVIELLSGFQSTDAGKIKMVKTFSATKSQIFFKVVFPSNLPTLFSSMKVNIGLSLVGVVAGEFLVSKSGLGYLIVYGGQVFKLDLVMTSVIILSVLAALLYLIISLLERTVIKTINHTF